MRRPVPGSIPWRVLPSMVTEPWNATMLMLPGGPPL
jgi:hypothetical protein